MTVDADVLRRAADLFHEMGSAIAARDLLVDCRNAVLAAKLRDNLRTSEQLRKLAAEGFELCVRALAASGATDVTLHECGESALGEQPWADDTSGMKCTGSLVHGEFSACPVHDHGESDRTRCTGTLVHGEFTACPVHDRRGS